MLLKSADDKSKRLALLENLLRSPAIDEYQKDWLYKELRNLKKGIQGEKDAAHYIDNYFKDSENHVILHDLRFVINEEVAQIDHLILTRSSNLYLLETKNYACDLIINDRGEFTAVYESGRFGIASPIEQSLRHERVLCKLLERLDIVGRTQKMPDFQHVVMLGAKATIDRPPAKVFDTSNVIKSDNFPTWHKKFSDQIGIGALFKTIFNLRSPETIKEWGEKLKRQHRPADLLALPDFMQPRPAAKPAAPAPAFAAPAKEPVCAHCAAKLSLRVAQYCQDNAKRFNGKLYCMGHQNLF